MQKLTAFWDNSNKQDIYENKEFQNYMEICRIKYVSIYHFPTKAIGSLEKYDCYSLSESIIVKRKDLKNKFSFSKSRIFNKKIDWSAFTWISQKG